MLAFCIQQHIHKIIFYKEKNLLHKNQKIVPKLMLSTEKFSEIISDMNILFLSDSRD
jgi:hypothetical protein